MTDPHLPARVETAAQTFIEEAATGAQRALAFAERCLEDALVYQQLERDMLRDERSLTHPEMTENSKQGASRRQAVRQFHEMAMTAAKTCMDLSQKALWFKQLIDERGGPAAGALPAQVEGDAPEGDSPLDRLRRIEREGKKAMEVLSPSEAGRRRRRQNTERLREGVVKGAEQILGESA